MILEPADSPEGNSSSVPIENGTPNALLLMASGCDERLSSEKELKAVTRQKNELHDVANRRAEVPNGARFVSVASFHTCWPRADASARIWILHSSSPSNLGARHRRSDLATLSTALFTARCYTLRTQNDLGASHIPRLVLCDLATVSLELRINS